MRKWDLISNRTIQLRGDAIFKGRQTEQPLLKQKFMKKHR